MLTNSSRRSENEVQIYACNAQIAYIDNTKSRARRYTSKPVRLGNMYIPIGTLFSKKILTTFQQRVGFVRPTSSQLALQLFL